ncbi:hypothetical protein [Pararhizobium gei]|uniref:hypothetical protein n=1 Tax=Pararhizobium gei TaxID=1395951 RepID=UPI0023DA8290|nr:hypothetical protein [Rhizobium gei]
MLDPIEIDENFEQLEFFIEQDIRYYSKRRIFFERMHRLAMLFVLITSGSASVALTGFFFSTEVSQLVAVLLTFFNGVIAALDIVIGFSTKARANESIYKQLSRLLDSAQNIKNTERNEDLLIKIKNSYTEYTIENPPVYKALRAMSYNEAIVSRAYDEDKFRKISFWKKIFSNVLPFSDSNFPLLQQSITGNHIAN